MGCEFCAIIRSGNIDDINEKYRSVREISVCDVNEIINNNISFSNMYYNLRILILYLVYTNHELRKKFDCIKHGVNDKDISTVTQIILSKHSAVLRYAP